MNVVITVDYCEDSLKPTPFPSYCVSTDDIVASYFSPPPTAAFRILLACYFSLGSPPTCWHTC